MDAKQAVFPSRQAMLPGIQLLRGCCAVMVVLSHANTMMGYPQYFGHSPLGLHEAGLFGVAIFFVISGFIIAFVSLGPDGAPRLSRSEFAKRRWTRIVPFMWISIFIYNLLSCAGSHNVEWWPALRATTLWPVGVLKPNVIWSLRHEFLFYGLFGWLMLGRRRHILPLLLWFIAPLFCWPMLWLVHYPIPARIPNDLGPWEELFHVVLLGANSGANLQFGVGFLLGWLTLRRNPVMATRFGTLAWTLLAALAAAFLAERADLPVGLTRDIVWTLLAAPPTWLAIVSVANSGILLYCGKTLGNASFALYLVHNGLLLALFGAARHIPGAPALLMYPVFVSVVVIAGLLIHRFVEKPLIAALAHGRLLAPWMRRVQRAPMVTVRNDADEWETPSPKQARTP